MTSFDKWMWLARSQLELATVQDSVRAVHQRLRRAEQTNALSEIEAGTAEFRQFDDASALLAGRIARLASSYAYVGDSRGTRQTPVIIER